MGDITILYLTNNRLPEPWVKFHSEKLLEAVGLNPVISFSREPVNIGQNLLQDQPPSKANIFWQMLRGAKLATTEYIAVAEDDTLYPIGHFDECRGDVVFNQHRWSLYTWNPVYSLKNFLRTNATFIGKTSLVIEALERRFKKYPMGSEMPYWMGGEIGVAEKHLDLPQYRVHEFKSINPVVQLDHDYFTVFEEKETVERRHNKKLGTIQAFDIPYWGSAELLTNLFI